MSKMLILGGTGNTGTKIAELLLRYADVEVILASRNEERLAAATQSLREEYSTDRVSWVQADASSQDSLVDVFAEVDMVVSAASTVQFTGNIARTCIASKCDYLDVQYSSEKVRILKSMISEIEQAGLCFISEAGFHPGLPAALVRFGARFFDKIDTAVVGSAISQDWRDLDLSPATQREFVREMMDYQSLFYQEGAWKKASMWTTKDFIKMDFGGEFKKRTCVPMFFEEMRPLPEDYPSLVHTGFYISGFGWFTDMIIMPTVMAGLKLFPKRAEKPMSKLMLWSLVRSSKPPFGVVMKLEASGQKDSKPAITEVRMFHEDGYWFTAIPVMACLLQYLDGTIRKPGLHWMGQLVEPVRLMEDMERMGIEISRT